MKKTEDIFLKLSKSKQMWQSFLSDLGIENFSKKEVSNLDKTIGLFEDEELVATGSVSGNIIKYVATCNKNGKGASYFNTIISELENYLLINGLTHYFVFTKKEYKSSFQYVGFQLLVESDYGVLLEKGKPNIQDYLSQYKPKTIGTNIAAIVMNANPFTLGHYALVESALKENEHVFVFVVSQNASLFKEEERLKLVKLCLKKLNNVTVLPTSDYMVSYATFPTYFLKQEDQATRFQTQIDARLFKQWIVPHFRISSRYLGDEPFSQTTKIYNEMLKEELEPEVHVKIIDRISVDSQIISASYVRQKIVEDNVQQIKKLVPETTYCFIKEHKKELIDRIEVNKTWK